MGAYNFMLRGGEGKVMKSLGTLKRLHTVGQTKNRS